MRRVKKYIRLLKYTGRAFLEDNCIKLSAALSYYTIFSIGPLLLLVISLSGLFYDESDVSNRLFNQIGGLVGAPAVEQIKDIIKNVKNIDGGVVGSIVGGIVLLLGATGIFTEIQDSINFIWSLRAKPKRGFLKLLINRLLSFSLIASLGFLLLVSLTINTLMDMLNDRLTRYFPDTTYYVFYVANIAIIFCFITVLFGIIFKVLPDGKIKWKDALIGASFTALLFMIGKAAIGFYLGNSTLGVTYGAAASVIIILTWVYYTSIILYFGAEFTKIYALEYGGGIVPNNTAVFIIKSEAKEIIVTSRTPKVS